MQLAWRAAPHAQPRGAHAGPCWPGHAGVRQAPPSTATRAQCMNFCTAVCAHLLPSRAERLDRSQHACRPSTPNQPTTASWQQSAIIVLSVHMQHHASKPASCAQQQGQLGFGNDGAVCRAPSQSRCAHHCCNADIALLQALKDACYRTLPTAAQRALNLRCMRCMRWLGPLGR
jgi:hypothetical protein